MLAQPLLEWCAVTPSSKKLVVLLGILGTVTMLMYGFVLGPRLNHGDALQDEAQQLDQALITQNRYGQQRIQLTGEVSVLRKRYQVLSEAVGMPLPVTDLFSGISKAANQAGVSLTLWKPESAAPTQGQDVSGTAARLEVEGNFHGLARFLGELARLPKALAVNVFSITASHRGSVHDTIHASLDLLEYDVPLSLGLVQSQVGSEVEFLIHDDH